MDKEMSPTLKAMLDSEKWDAIIMNEWTFDPIHSFDSMLVKAGEGMPNDTWNEFLNNWQDKE